MTAEHAELQASLEQIAVERAGIVGALDQPTLGDFRAGVETTQRRRASPRHAMASARSATCACGRRCSTPCRRNEEIIQCDSCNAHPLLRAGAGGGAPTRPSRRSELVDIARRTDAIDRRVHRRRRARQSRARPVSASASSSPTARWSKNFSESIGVADQQRRRIPGADRRARLGAGAWRTRVHVRSDSLLLVQQMLGNYKVKHPGLQPLSREGAPARAEIGRVTFEHVGRAPTPTPIGWPTRLWIYAVGTGSAEPRGASTRGPHPPAPTSEADPFSSLERAVRLFVYDHFVRTTKAPDFAAITAAVKRTPMP